jgi:hypothetical protein
MVSVEPAMPALMQTCHGVRSEFLLHTDGRTLCTEDQPVARPLLSHEAIEARNKRKNVDMPLVRLEPRTPVFEWTMRRPLSWAVTGN